MEQRLVHGSCEEALNTLITRRYRIPTSDASEALTLMNVYLKILQLDESLSSLNIIHVAGTKGKGSTCVFSESILRACGYKTGLFTSPHLVDVRERFRFNGVEVSETVFQKHFWWCWDRLQEGCKQDLPMPSYFRFLTLLAFKMFICEKVDVVILEVGLGGKYDPTNVIKTPDVCGITSLGFDHMAILGNTLPEIASEKAGIFKPGVPAVTSPQREDAIDVLKHRASELSIPLEVVKPLVLPEGLQLGLKGDHQLVNAALAVALCNIWIKKHGNPDILRTDELPEEYKHGLATVQLLGRGQIERDSDEENLIFYLDGAHSPESMEACGNWFSTTVKSMNAPSPRNLLLFNCMSERDPQLLFPPLLNSCHHHGVSIQKALFVSTGTGHEWQHSLQKSWDGFQASAMFQDTTSLDGATSVTKFSLVLPSPATALGSLRTLARQQPSSTWNVLVTGSLHLIGDLLKLLKH